MDAVGRTLDQEMTLLREAIALVAGGGSRRVIVAGLRFGDQLLDRARRLALEAHVRVVPLWMPDDAGADIAIEAIDG
jgi:hypothetical protein